MFAPVPRAAKSFGQELARAMTAAGISQRQLAHRLADAHGGKPESKRRWLGKVLRGQVAQPSEQSIQELASVLELDPGYFTSAKVVPIRSRLDRLAALEEEVARLQAEREDVLQAVVVRLAEVEAVLATAGLLAVPEKSAKARRR